MSIEARNQQYYFKPTRKTTVSLAPKTAREIDEMLANGSLAKEVEPAVMNVGLDQSDTTKGWFYNPLHDLESILWLFARQLLFQDQYLQWTDGRAVNEASVRAEGSVTHPPLIETPEERVQRLMAYFTFGYSLFVNRTDRVSFIRDPRWIPHQLDHHRLHPAVRGLGDILSKMRDNLEAQYIKHEAQLEKIDHLCADELHYAFANDLTDAYVIIKKIEDGKFDIMTRSLQAQVEKLHEQAKMAAQEAAPSEASTVSQSSKRSREDSADDDEESTSHPSKSPRTETNQSPRRFPIETPEPQLSSVPVLPVSPPLPVAPANNATPAIVPKARPKRSIPAVPPTTRTLRSHARNALKLECAPPPPAPSPPPAPKRMRKVPLTAARGGKVTKNNEVARAAAKIAAKIKTKTRKGR